MFHGASMSHRFSGLLALSVSLVVSNLAAQGPTAADMPPATPPGGAGYDAGVSLMHLQLANEQGDVAADVKVNLSGWMRVDYGYGNRFGSAAGRDELGISKM